MNMQELKAIANYLWIDLFGTDEAIKERKIKYVGWIWLLDGYWMSESGLSNTYEEAESDLKEWLGDKS